MVWPGTERTVKSGEVRFGGPTPGALASTRPSRAIGVAWLPWWWNGCRSRPALTTRISSLSPGCMRGSALYGWVGSQ